MKIKGFAAVGSALILGIMAVGCGGDHDSAEDTQVPPIQVTQGTVIQDATVVDTRDGSLSRNVNVIIRDGKIQGITGESVQVGATAEIVDGSGKYLVPGFLDMHAHVMDAIDADPNSFPLMLANGVTGVREMSGSETMINRVRQVNADIAAGVLDAPEILMVHGGFFEGPPITADAGVQFVQAKAALDADYIKLLAGAPDFIMAVLQEAQAQGLTVAGHLPLAVSALDASNAGWHIMEHLGAGLGLLLDCSTDEMAIRISALTGGYPTPIPPTPEYITNPHLFDATQNAPFYQGVLDTYSESQCQSLAQAFVQNDTWQVPTLIRLHTMHVSDEQNFRTDPNLMYVAGPIRALWEQMAQQWETTIPEAAVSAQRDYFTLEQQVTKLLSDAGVKMLAGSDASSIAIWTIPGFSLHREFKELAAAGLTPLQILQATTLNGAEFLGRQSTMGTIEEGKNADLVLLDANPLEDVANLDGIAAVFLRGKHFSRSDLDQMLADVATAYQSSPL